jgi:hypothetical protein
MGFRDIVAHYEGVLRADSAWLSEGLAWTVVLPRAENLSLTEVGQRLTGGGRPVMSELEEVDERDLIYLGWSDTATAIVEPDGFSYAGHPPVLKWLSRNAQAWHLSWNLTGSSRLCYATDGNVLAEVHGLKSAVAVGADANSISAEVAMLREAVGSPWPALQATAMAIVESRTGACLDQQWFEEPRVVVHIDQPISPDIPPLGFSHHERDLDSKIQHVSQATRNTIFIYTIEELINRFDLGLVRISEGLQAAREGRPLGESQWHEMDTVREELGHQWAGQPTAEREQDTWGWRRWVAANAVRHSLRSLSENSSYLDGLTFARFAFSEEWPVVREQIRELARDID